MRAHTETPDWPHWSIRYYPSVTSTNDLCKALGKEGAPHGTVIVAEAQTAGRGRMGRSFSSPPGGGVYLSVLLRPECKAEQLMHLTCAAAVAAADAVKEAAGITPDIKWINDLQYKGKKLAGILTELSLRADGTVEYAVVGMGINCLQAAFPEEIADIAVSLAQIPGARAGKAPLVRAVVKHFRRTLSLPPEEIMAVYRLRCITLGKAVTVHTAGGQWEGVAEALENDGTLNVRDASGVLHNVNSGEVQIRLK